MFVGHILFGEFTIIHSMRIIRNVCPHNVITEIIDYLLDTIHINHHSKQVNGNKMISNGNGSPNAEDS